MMNVASLKRFSSLLNRVLMAIGGLFLGGMVVLTCANIFLRSVWVPIRGTFELMGFAGAVVTAFALGRTQQAKGHIAVDVLLNVLSPRLRRVLMMTSHCLCALFFSLAAWQVAQKALVLMHTGEVTETLRMIYYPFTFAVALGCAALTLSLIIDVIAMLYPEKVD